MSIDNETRPARLARILTYKNKPLTITRVAIAVYARMRRAAIVLNPSHSIKTAYGPRMVKRVHDATFRYAVFGSYGRFISDVIEHIEHPFVFLDIGANAGLYSLLASAHDRCTHVVAIEPVPATYAALVENIAINSADKVISVRGAVSTSTSKFLPMIFNSDHSGSARIDNNLSSPNPVMVDAISAARLGQLLSTTDDPIVLKVDVEGSEADVLFAVEGAGLFRRISDALIEMSSKTGTGLPNVRSVRDIMARNGYAECGKQPDGDTFHYDAHFVRIQTK